MNPQELIEEFMDYAIFYACEGDEGYDGIHDGGVKGLKDNAPQFAVEAYEEYAEMLKEAEEEGIKF